MVAEAADAESEGTEEPEEDSAEESEPATEAEELESAMAEEGADEAPEAEEEEDPEPDDPVIRHEGTFYGTGRRKTSVARVWIEAGDGEILVNDESAHDYFNNRARWVESFMGPLKELDFESDIDVWATLEGGGKTGQADALQLGIARALVEMDENARHFLRPPGYLTRDDRQVERKKMNQPGARAKSQVSKR